MLKFVSWSGKICLGFVAYFFEATVNGIFDEGALDCHSANSRNANVSPWQVVSFLTSLCRYKKPEADDGDPGLKNPFSSGYSMLDTGPGSDSPEHQLERGFFNKGYRKRSASNPVVLTGTRSILDEVWFYKILFPLYYNFSPLISK